MKRVFMILLLLFIVSLVPAAYRSVVWAADAKSLVTVAMLDEGQHTLNPYSMNGSFITPTLAAWMLFNLDYPYERCGEISRVVNRCDSSLIGLLGRALDIGEDATTTERGYVLLHHFIERGLPLDKHMETGLTPAQEAIFFNNPHHLKVLVEAGASLTVKSDDHSIFGAVDSHELVTILEARDDRDYSAVRRIVDRDFEGRGSRF